MKLRTLPAAAMATCVLVVSLFTGIGCGGSHPKASPGTDTGLCPFPLAVTVTGTTEPQKEATTLLRFAFGGPSRIQLRNTATGRTATLVDTSSYSANAAGTIAVTGHKVWRWSAGDVPFLTTDGAISLKGPDFVLAPGSSQARVIDPCALVGSSPPSTKPITTPAPWGLPSYPLSHIAYAGLTPLLGTLARHDHVHLDVIVDGKAVTIPAGIGLVEPLDTGPCPDTGELQGDCATHHISVAQVANSPLHTHSTSGIIHVEPDRPGTYTLGQFFAEWGVRLTAGCVGGYCTGGDKELRVYVDGKRVSGDPRAIALGNRQEIAIVYGGASDFASVPSTYKGGWPGIGCGGSGEISCHP